LSALIVMDELAWSAMNGRLRPDYHSRTKGVPRPRK
jgi:hypothetical protein